MAFQLNKFILDKRRDSTEMAAAMSPNGYSIGICATGMSRNLDDLLERIEGEQTPEGFLLRKIIVVASDCTSDALASVRLYASKDRRIELVEEPKRSGKAQAINKIIDLAQGEFLIFLNSDAFPSKGSIEMLLQAIQRDNKIGMVSGCPVFHQEEGTTSDVLNLMWSVHNQYSLELNHRQLSNHCTDEMMVMRRNALKKLPLGVVNDGAYLAGHAKLRGFSIKFCDKALVTIDVPPRITDLIEQRRRILFGHFQIWKLTGSAPRTVESMFLFAPLLSLGVAIKIIAKFPKLARVLPVAAVGEGVSFVLALIDSIKSTNKHGIWKRYGN